MSEERTSFLGGEPEVADPCPPSKSSSPDPFREEGKGQGAALPDPWREKSQPGLYVHVPFCLRKCHYCDFYSCTDTALARRWLAALEKEVRLYQEIFPPFETLYLGGGTPSLLAPPDLALLLDNLYLNLAFLPEAEITLEANPDDLSPEKLTAYRLLGINRLSLGVQSLEERELELLGRRHTARQAEAALNAARRAGFENLGVDLIYGLPGQTLPAWEKTLEQVMVWRPEHLSCYQLTVAAGTELARREAAGEMSLPGEESALAFFLFTSEYLAGQGYLHYEVSNFARGREYLSRHNSKYWDHAPYLGLGPAAHSFQARRRWWNHRSLSAYCQALDSDKAPVAEEEHLTAEQLRLEELLLGLRTREGVSLDLVETSPRDAEVLAGLKTNGLLQVDQGRARPTRTGLAVADRLARLFA